MSYAERHIVREMAHLKAAEAVADADRGGAIRRLLAIEADRVRAAHAKRLRDDASVLSAHRLFKDIDSFLAGQGGSDAFPGRLFRACPEDVRWRFCAAALRDVRVSRGIRAQLVAWMMCLAKMNVTGNMEVLRRILDEEGSAMDVLFPSRLVRVEYCRRRLPGWRDVADGAGEEANPAAYALREWWEDRFCLTAEEELGWDQDDGPRFALALSLSGHRISRTLLLGLVRYGRWGILQFLYQTFDACWRILSVEKILSLLCSNGGIPAEANGLKCVASRGFHGFIDFLMLKRPDCVAKVRDPFGCNLLWQTFYRTQTSHRMGKIYQKIERLLVDCGCDPHETTSLGVSWADVALAQYEAGILVRERDFNLQQGNSNAALDTWFHDLVGARPKEVET